MGLISRRPGLPIFCITKVPWRCDVAPRRHRAAHVAALVRPLPTLPILWSTASRSLKLMWHMCLFCLNIHQALELFFLPVLSFLALTEF